MTLKYKYETEPKYSEYTFEASTHDLNETKRFYK